MFLLSCLWIWVICFLIFLVVFLLVIIVVLFLLIEILWLVFIIFRFIIFRFRLIFFEMSWLFVRIVIFWSIVLWRLLKLGVFIAVIFSIFFVLLIIKVVKVFFLIFLVIINKDWLVWVIFFSIGIKFWIEEIFLLVIKMWVFLKLIINCFWLVIK